MEKYNKFKNKYLNIKIGGTEIKNDDDDDNDNDNQSCISYNRSDNEDDIEDTDDISRYIIEKIRYINYIFYLIELKEYFNDMETPLYVILIKDFSTKKILSIREFYNKIIKNEDNFIMSFRESFYTFLKEQQLCTQFKLYTITTKFNNEENNKPMYIIIEPIEISFNEDNNYTPPWKIINDIIYGEKNDEIQNSTGSRIYKILLNNKFIIYDKIHMSQLKENLRILLFNPYTFGPELDIFSEYYKTLSNIGNFSKNTKTKDIIITDNIRDRFWKQCFIQFINFYLEQKNNPLNIRYDIDGIFLLISGIQFPWLHLKFCKNHKFLLYLVKSSEETEKSIREWLFNINFNYDNDDDDNEFIGGGLVLNSSKTINNSKLFNTNILNSSELLIDFELDNDQPITKSSKIIKTYNNIVDDDDYELMILNKFKTDIIKIIDFLTDKQIENIFRLANNRIIDKLKIKKINNNLTDKKIVDIINLCQTTFKPKYSYDLDDELFSFLSELSISDEKQIKLKNQIRFGIINKKHFKRLDIIDYKIIIIKINELYKTNFC